MVRRKLLPLVVTIIAMAPLGVARTPGAPLRPGFNFFSKEQDVQLGREAAQQVRQKYQIVQNQDLQDYINRIGQRLASQPEAGGFPYSFTVVADPSINAFALPGGPTFVHTGLVSAADNEAQLAGVLAHEISHVALRHATHNVSKANLLQIPAMLAGAVAGQGMMGQLAQLGIGLGFNSILLKYSRDAESQADALGSHLMAEAGWNPLEMARFFEKLQAQGGRHTSQFFSDHPNPGNRERAIEAEIRTLPQRNYGQDTGGFQRAKSFVAGIGPGTRGGQRSFRQPPDSPSNGRPSGRMRELRTQNFTLGYPDKWQVFGENNSSSVTIAPREGLVQDPQGNTAIGYGAIVSYYNPESAGDLNSATDELIHHLHAGNPSMQITSRDRRAVRVGNSEGLVTMMESNSPYGNAEVDALMTVVRPEGLFYMIFIAPQSEFRNVQSSFEEMIHSIRFNGN